MSLHVGDHDQAWERTDYISNTPRLVHSQVVFEHLHLTTQTPNEHTNQASRTIEERTIDPAMSLSALAYAPHGDSPNAASPHIDTLVAQILSAPTLTALNTLLKGLARDSGSGSSNAASGGGGGTAGGGSGGGGEAQLLGFLSDGRDPLEGVLDVRTHGLALLYILCVVCLLSLSSFSFPYVFCVCVSGIWYRC